MKKLIVLILLLFSFFKVYSQSSVSDSLMNKINDFGKYLLYRNHDTSYIQNYSEEFTLKLLALNKINYFKIADRINDSSIRYRPDRRINLGLGVSYKWFSIDLAFNFGIGERNELKDNDIIDFQFHIFSSKQYISTTLQYYYGHQVERLKVFGNVVPYDSIRSDIRTTQIGIQYLFAFSYDKFSLKASFIINELQKKSAGSWTLGASFNYFTMGADSIVVPSEYQQFFDERAHLTDVSAITSSVIFGYMHTFVWGKHFFLTLGFLPGLSLNIGDYRVESRTRVELHPQFKFKSMNAIGYNSRRYFLGLQIVGDLNLFRLEPQLFNEFGSGRVKLFAGYRFRTKTQRQEHFRRKN